MSGPRTSIGSAPPAAAHDLRLAGRTVDVSSTALVVGRLAPRGGDGGTGAGLDSDDALLRAAADHADAGAAAVCIPPYHEPATTVAAVAAVRARLDIAVMVRTDDVDELRDVLDAGATLAWCGAPPSAEYLDVVAIRDATLVVTDPAGDVARLASSCGLPAEQVVLETGPDGPGDRALTDALHTVAPTVGRGHPVAWRGDEPAAIAWAVTAGARAVLTHDTAPAVRIVRTFAAIAEAGAL